MPVYSIYRETETETQEERSASLAWLAFAFLIKRQIFLVYFIETLERTSHA